MDNLKIPYHVGIILDGNGRWAQRLGKSRSDGHKTGYNNLKKLSVYILNRGVKYLSIYVFSTENFKRSVEEVKFLMDLIVKKFRSDAKYFLDNNVKVIFSGSRNNLRSDVQEAIDYLTNLTKNNTRGILNVCLNYGSRLEITDMVKKVVCNYQNGLIKLEDIDEEYISHNLYQDLPDIDFLIRTSGEMRLSNFMLWQASYAELYFPSVYFPDFNDAEFEKALIEYNERDRRFGGIINNKK